MSTQRQLRMEQLEALLDTFNTEGWKIFASDCNALGVALLRSAAHECDTGEKWMERRGRLLALEEVLGYAPAAMNELKNIDSATFDDEESHNETNELED